MEIKRDKIITGILIGAMLFLILWLVVDLLPLVKEIYLDRKDVAKVVPYIEAYGPKGVPIIIGLQMLQVIVVIIPGSAVQLLAGLCYGLVYGSLLCVVGFALGNLVIFLLVRQFRKIFHPALHRQEKNAKHKLPSIESLNQMAHPEYLAFFLYVIPFMPNGFLPYLFAQTRITPLKYLAATTLASIPSTILCTWMGESLAKGNYVTSLILVGVLALLAVIAFIFKKPLLHWVQETLGMRKKPE